MRATSKALIAATALALAAACAGPPAPPEVWGRLDGQPASDADKARFLQDEAGCEYDLARMDQASRAGRPTQAGLSGPGALADAIARRGDGPGLFASCMAARGWARRG